MRKTLLLFLLITTCATVFGQYHSINNQALHFIIPTEEENIDFILADTTVKEKKPIFLWCQGSLPIPLFIESKNQELFFFGGGASNFDMNVIRKEYHFIVISMPKTPLIAHENDLTSSFYLYDKTISPPQPTKEFSKADYLENYVERAKIVLDFLRKQAWVDTSKLIIAGHSQGAYIASRIGLEYNGVSHIGLFGVNPFGRISQAIMQTKKDLTAKKITIDNAVENIESQYELCRNAFNPALVEEYPFLLSWQSFSKPVINEWLKIETPIYLAYGTEDMASYLCDLVPLFFIQENKNNLTVKRYRHLEHNFFEVHEDGTTDYNKANWKEVMNAFVEWTKDVADINAKEK